LGDTDLGGLGGILKVIAGVSGGSVMLLESEKPCVGEEEKDKRVG
jgi:hypothetical protein